MGKGSAAAFRARVAKVEQSLRLVMSDSQGWERMPVEMILMLVDADLGGEVA